MLYPESSSFFSLLEHQQGEAKEATLVKGKPNSDCLWRGTSAKYKEVLGASIHGPVKSDENWWQPASQSRSISHLDFWQGQNGRQT